MKNLKDYIIPTGVLMIICLVVAFALVGTYQITAPVIAQVAKEQEDTARSEVLPKADSFTKMEDKELIEGVLDVYVENNGSGVVITSVDKGFGGEIKFMTGFDPSGKITGIKMTAHTETPGLGTKVGLPDHIKQYIGQENLDSIVAITGATISSDAMLRAEQKAVDQFGKVKGAL